MFAVRLLLVLFLSNTVLYLFPQSAISGRVSDNENEAIEFALVALKQVNDSSVVAYTITDESGRYTLKINKQGDFLVHVSYLGYTTQIKQITLSEDTNVTDFDFIMSPDVISLQEIVVKGRKTGILFDNDTIRYDIQSFKDGSEVVLGDVLNKLPGIEVDEKGAVKAQGKQVDKILLNGQDFFQGNTQMATKNLAADIAESVEVLNNYSEYSILSGFQSHENTVIFLACGNHKTDHSAIFR